MIDTPYVELDLTRLEKNIKEMSNKLKLQNIEHWPHIKSHKSIELAKMQIEYGANGITCAKLAEAECMAKGGITSIFVAYPIVGDNKCDRYAKLSKKISVKTIVDSEIGAKQLSTAAITNNCELDVYIAIDYGAHREGIQVDQLIDFTKKISKLPRINIIGVFTYAGTIYQYKDESSIRKAAKAEALLLTECANLLQQFGFDIKHLSGGSTLSSFYAEDLHGITESRAGNYIFGDMNAINANIYTPKNCALTVCSTVISIPIPGYATIDAGTKSLSSDLSGNSSSFGMIIENPKIQLVKLNEEHGYLRYDPNEIPIYIGQRLHIIPNHCCVVPNLTRNIFAFKNLKFDHEIMIDAHCLSY